MVPKNWLEAEEPPLLSKLVLPLVFKPPFKLFGLVLLLELKLKPALTPLEEFRRALVPMSLLARVVSLKITVKVSPTLTARRSSNKPLWVVATTLVVGTKEPLEAVVISNASGLAVVEPLMNEGLEAEGSSAQPTKKAVNEMRQANFFITVVLTSAEFDLMQTQTWR
jgi:hypothetical protein